MGTLIKNVRQIKSSFNGDRIVLAQFSENVQIYDVRQRKIISDLNTILDFGGDRILIDDIGKNCVFGSWEQNRIQAYDINSGKKTWERKLKGVQKFQQLRSKKNAFFVQLENESSRLIDLETGEDIQILKGVYKYYESRYHELNAFALGKRISITERNSSKEKVIIKNQSFAVLDISFTPSSILISESAMPLRNYDIYSGKLLWQLDIREGFHFVKIAYCEHLKKVIGISWNYNGGDENKITYINPETGHIEKEILIGRSSEFEFLYNGDMLITSDLNLIDISTQSIVQL